MMDRRTGDKEHKVEEFKYKCRYCQMEFKKMPRYSPPVNEFGKEAKHGGCSDQIECPQCHNFMRTWEDAKK